MTKWLVVICSLVIAIGAGAALADLNYTQGSGTTIFDFTCFATKHCSAHVPIDSTGTEKATTANPWIISGTPTLGASSSTIGSVNLAVGDPCTGSAKTNVAIAASTATVQLVAGTASKKTYVCSVSLIANALVGVSLIEGTGALCVTANSAAIIGSTVATQGMAFTTNGGITLGGGAGTVGFTATAANNLCLLQSLTTSMVSGNLTYVQQ